MSTPDPETPTSSVGSRALWPTSQARPVSGVGSVGVTASAVPTRDGAPHFSGVGTNVVS